MFDTDGNPISVQDIFAPADSSDVFIFDVDISSHDALQQGIIATGIVQVAVSDASSLADAAQVACRLAARHGMPTRAALVQVLI